MTARRAKKPKRKRVLAANKNEMIYLTRGLLSLWDKNPRVNDDAAKKLAEIIEQYGFVSPVVAAINTPGLPDHTILKGNTSFKAAELLGLEEIPVVLKTFESEEEAEMYALADNKASEWADWDYAKLAALFESKTEVSPEVLAAMSGFSVKEIEWQGPDASIIDDLDDYDEDQENYILRIQNVSPMDKDTLVERITLALEGTGYDLEVY